MLPQERRTLIDRVVQEAKASTTRIEIGMPCCLISIRSCSHSYEVVVRSPSHRPILALGPISSHIRPAQYVSRGHSLDRLWVMTDSWIAKKLPQ
jgi:hypothetical protein